MSTIVTRRTRPDAALRRPIDPRIMRRAEAIAGRYQITLWREDGHWFGRGAELPLCMGDGRTIAGCVRVTRRSLVLGVVSLLENGESVPAPALDQERKRSRRAG